MILSSTGFEDGGVLPSQFSGLAANPVSPPLSWVNAPAGTKSFVLQLRDMEPIRDKNFVDVIHWLAFDIPGTSTSLPQGIPATATLPDGTVQIANFSGKPGFIAPGAPPGVYHHYLIELFALDTTLLLPSTASRDQVLAAMSGHILGKAVATFRFHR
jgi:Raf kinase inhibitor-like YbhB/YbcL family protein